MRLRALAAAFEQRDAAALARLLTARAQVVVDSGGASPIPGATASGIGASVVLLLRVSSALHGCVATEHPVNGGAGLVVRRGTAVVAVIGVELRRRRVSRVLVVLNSEKLRRWNCR